MIFCKSHLLNNFLIHSFLVCMFNTLIAENTQMIKFETFIPHEYNFMLESFKQKASPELYESA